MTRKSPSQSDIKLLYGLAAARCAFPGCKELCAASATKEDRAVPLGNIAHIVAYSNDGPRANPNLDEKDRNGYSNLILLCANHHELVDKQHGTHTTEDLRKWKSDHEQWICNQLKSSAPDIGFCELDLVTRALVAVPMNPTTNFELTNPLEKIKKNSLSETSSYKISIGLSKAKEVEEFMQNMAKVILDFPERITKSFMDEYGRLTREGYGGDALFENMHEFASLGKKDFMSLTVGLIVLVYLFEKCEVFEK